MCPSSVSIAHLLLLAAICLPSLVSCKKEQIAVLVPGGAAAADALAARHGMRNAGQIGALDNYYLFEHEAHR